MSLVMSGQVFAAVDSGRRDKRAACAPSVRSFWIRQVRILDMDASVCFSFRIRLGSAAGSPGRQEPRSSPGPSQTTNSVGLPGAGARHGCRLPWNRPGRLVHAGLSEVGDEQTPPEQLRKSLKEELRTEVSILNTGTLGYCPEHYYYTLVEFIDRFRPRFVVVGLYSNDFGEDADVLARIRRLGRGEALAEPDCADLPCAGDSLRDRTGAV